MLFVSNAAGGSGGRCPGDLMIIDDHINLMGATRSWAASRKATALPDMSAPYDRELRARCARSRASRHPADGGRLRGELRAAYETPAEVRMFELGVDAVGMSTVPEVVAARAACAWLGISCITNQAAGMTAAPLAPRRSARDRRIQTLQESFEGL